MIETATLADVQTTRTPAGDGATVGEEPSRRGDGGATADRFGSGRGVVDLDSVQDVDLELEAALEYKLATGAEAVGDVLAMVARVIERRSARA